VNNYPTWWNETLTVYNRYEDPITNLVTWYSHVITGCFWKYIGNKVHINDVVLDTKDIICRIRIRDDFMEKYEWINLPADSKANFFTLGKGDIIVKGEVDDEISEYVAGHRSNDLVKKYKELQGCMVIDEYTINTGGGRGNEHYHVRGA